MPETHRSAHGLQLSSLTPPVGQKKSPLVAAGSCDTPRPFGAGTGCDSSWDLDFSKSLSPLASRLMNSPGLWRGFIGGKGLQGISRDYMHEDIPSFGGWLPVPKTHK